MNADMNGTKAPEPIDTTKLPDYNVNVTKDDAQKAAKFAQNNQGAMQNAGKFMNKMF